MMSSIGSVWPQLAADKAVQNAAPEGTPAGGGAAPGSGPDKAAAAAAVTPSQLKAAVDAANQQLAQSNRELAFVFDDRLGRMLVKIVDRSTNTVIRQVPSEDMLAAARALSGTQARGALLTNKA
jgi:flagellar protein FlaG